MKFPTQKIFFIEGAAGCGKTYLVNLLTKYISVNLQKKILCTATTGIAATLVEGGVTFHYAFGIPVPCIHP